MRKKSKIRNALIASACAFALTGCQGGPGPNTAVGAGVGAILGAAAGSLIGGKNRRRNALIGAGIGLLAGAAIGNYLDQQQRALETSLAGTGAEVKRYDDYILVTMPANVTFDTGQSVIRSEFYGTLNQVAESLNRYPQSYIDVVGHTDSRGGFEYNQQLSERRAVAVRNYLSSQGVNSARLAAYGQGETKPVADNTTPEGRQANRRVELKIVPASKEG